jgi:hypothetical protein
MVHPIGADATDTQRLLPCDARPATSPTEEPVTGTRSMRVEPPDLDPDDAFVARLALAARYSPRGVRRAHRFGSGRLLLATAGIAVVTTGGAYAVGVLGPLGPIGPLGRDDSPPHHQQSPASDRPTEGTEPVPASPGGTGDAGKPSGKPSDHPSGKPTGRPTGQPSGVPSGGPSEHPTHPTKKPHPTKPPTGKPPDKPSGQPTDKPTGKPGAKPWPVTTT